MRPGVVWFGEQLSQNELERVEDFLDGGTCDVVIVAGTTATFGYIIDWALRGSRDGAELIEVNPGGNTALTIRNAVSARAGCDRLAAHCG